MSNQLPAVIVLDQTAVGNTGGGGAVPVVIAQAGEQASWRYVEFFTANKGTGQIGVKISANGRCQ